MKPVKPKTDMGSSNAASRGLLMKAVWRLARPMLLSQLFYAAYSIADVVFLGLVGPAAIAAASMAAAVEYFNWTLLTAVDIACRSLVARLFGAGDRRGARQIIFQSFLLSSAVSMVIAACGYFLARPFLLLLGANEEFLGESVRFLRILALGSITLFTLQIGKAVMEAVGDAHTPMKVMLVSALANIALDPILIFGLGPLPPLGASGAAIATLLGRLLGIAILTKAIFWNEAFPLRLGPHDLTYQPEAMRELIFLAAPRSLQRLLELLSGLVLMRLVASYGTYAIAAHGIGLRIDLAIRTPGYGFSNAAVTLVGQEVGGGEKKRAGRIVWVVAINYMMVTLAPGLLFTIFPREIMTLFAEQGEVIQLGASYLRIMAAAFVFLAMGMIFERALAGTGDTVSPMLISALHLSLLQIGLAVLLSPSLGVAGVWAANATAYTLWGVTLAMWFHKGQWTSHEGSRGSSS